MTTFQGTTKIREAHKGVFPKVSKHQEARCLCGAALRHPRTGVTKIDGVPEHAEGQWFGQCALSCGLGGFYDLTTEDKVPLDQGLAFTRARHSRMFTFGRTRR